MNKYLVFLLIICLASCKSDDEFYPNVITEFAMLKTDENGTMTEMTTDNERTYALANPQSGYEKNVRYRAVCGFIPHGEAATLQYATGAYLLRDSTELAIESNATGVVSVWKSGRYINMQLSPLTQGGTQYWGYRCDSISGRTLHLCLHHRQNGDPLSYTQTVYASIPIDSLRAVSAGDTIALHILTFQGDRLWTFPKQ